MHERRAAERFQVPHTTARLRQARAAGIGEADLERDGLPDAPSTPRRSPRRTSNRQVKKVLRLRRRGWGPARIGPHAGIPVSTVAEVRRYERSAAGELVRMDVRRLGRIPDGGGWHVHGRGNGARSGVHGPKLGYAYLHTVLDDHSRLAYTEILTNEQGPTTAAFWRRACSWFADHGVRIERVLTDNGSNYRYREMAAALAATGVVHKRTRPSESARVRALPNFLHLYNHHRHHAALGGRPPISRVTDLRAQYI